MKTLRNPRHEIVAQELAKGATADAAYRAAGYKPDRGHASRLASKGSIRARVAGLLAGGASKAEITFERTIAELAAIAFSQVTNFMRIGEDGLPILDFSNLTDEDRIALAEVTVTQ